MPTTPVLRPLRGLATVGVFVIAALATAPALAADPTFPGVYGGEEVPDCHWPNVVSMGQGGSCSGTLLRPDLVIYAAHCGTYDFIRVASSVDDSDDLLVPTERCNVHPKWGSGLGLGYDFAYCTLAETVDDVPIIPPLMGCELDALQPGESVWAVGFGYDEDRNYGIKHSVEMPIIAVDLDNEILVGETNVASICNGDSGGPLAIQLPSSIDLERSWRVFGVTSWGSPNCWDANYFGLMHNAVTWIENDSGVDVTPCHDADGTWRGGPECEGFPLDPVSGQGSWDSGCTYPGASTGVVTTCGSAAADTDDVAPEVSIVSPLNGLRGEVDGNGQFAVDVLGDVTDEGWGIERVSLRVGDEPLPGSELLNPPFAWPLNLPEGQYVLYLDAVDKAGNEASSDPLLLGVGMDPPAPPPPPPGDDSGDGGTGNAGSDGGTDDGAGATMTEDEGCACEVADDASRTSPGWLVIWVVGLSGLVWRRRRGQPLVPGRFVHATWCKTRLVSKATPPCMRAAWGSSAVGSKVDPDGARLWFHSLLWPVAGHGVCGRPNQRS